MLIGDIVYKMVPEIAGEDNTKVVIAKAHGVSRWSWVDGALSTLQNLDRDVFYQDFIKKELTKS